MKLQRLVGSSFRAMAKNKLRTVFMMLGTVIGVTALTVVMAYGRGTQDALLHSIERLFSGSSILLTAGGGRMGNNPHGAGPATTLTLADLDAIEAGVPGVHLIDPSQSSGAREVAFEGNVGRPRVIGYSEKSEVVWNRGVSRGSYFTQRDVQSSARVALVGETVVTEVFGDVDPIGQQIRIGTVPFQVVGVLEVFGTDPHGLDKDNEVIVPISTMMRRLMNVDYIQGSKLLMSERANLETAVSSIEGILRERHALGPDEPNDFNMITPVQVEAMVASTNRVFTLFLPLIAAVSILVGGVVVANLMFMSINERRSEIGLRKAMGARTRDIWWQFVLEAATITSIAGLVAIVLGAITMRIITGLTGTETAFPWEVTLIGLATAVGVGLVAGAFPARRAAAMDPVTTLR